MKILNENSVRKYEILSKKKIITVEESLGLRKQSVMFHQKSKRKECFITNYIYKSRMLLHPRRDSKQIALFTINDFM